MSEHFEVFVIWAVIALFLFLCAFTASCSMAFA
jgi:hypothetical protein